MVPGATIAACAVSLFVSLLLPVLCLVIYGIRNRRQGVWSAWLLGAAGFFVPQMLIRTPILNVLAADTGFVAFSQLHPWLFGVGLAFTAAAFELLGRLGAALAMKRRLTSRRALAAGMGHGGVEAILIIGLTYINNLVYIVMIQTGSLDALIAQLSASGADTAQLAAIRESLVSTSPGLFLLAGFERLITMVCHASLSVMVCYGAYSRRLLPWSLACLGIHSLMDSTGCIQYLGLSQAAAYGIIYLLLTAVAVACVCMMVRILRKWHAAEAEPFVDN